MIRLQHKEHKIGPFRRRFLTGIDEDTLVCEHLGDSHQSMPTINWILSDYMEYSDRKKYFCLYFDEETFWKYYKGEVGLKALLRLIERYDFVVARYILVEWEEFKSIKSESGDYLSTYYSVPRADQVFIHSETKVRMINLTPIITKKAKKKLVELQTSSYL